MLCTWIQRKSLLLSVQQLEDLGLIVTSNSLAIIPIHDLQKVLAGS